MAFSFHDSTPAELNFPGLTAELTEGLGNGTAKFDMNVVGIPRYGGSGASSPIEPGPVTLVWEYSTDLFDRETVDRISRELPSVSWDRNPVCQRCCSSLNSSCFRTKRFLAPRRPPPVA